MAVLVWRARVPADKNSLISFLNYSIAAIPGWPERLACILDAEWLTHGSTWLMAQHDGSRSYSAAERRLRADADAI